MNLRIQRKVKEVQIKGGTKLCIHLLCLNIVTSC